MIKDYQISDIQYSFTARDIEKAIENINTIVEMEYVGTESEAMENEYIEGYSFVEFIDQEGYFMIPMGYLGISFDYGDTSSGGIMLPFAPYGETKEKFKRDILNLLLEVKNILE